MRLSAAAPFILSILIGPASALATPGDGRDPAAAESLFQRGVERMKIGDWGEACKAFEASMKLDPSVGTQINVARCSEHNGHVAQAWADYRKAKALNSETPLEKRKANVDAFVDGEIKKLEPRIPFVTIKVSIHGPPGEPPRKPSDIAGLKVERDDSPIPIEGLSVAVPVDPGKHVFKASAPSYRSARVEVDFAEAAKRDVVLDIVFEPPAKVPVPIAEPPRRDLGEADHPKGSPPLLVTGITLAAIGGATLVVSAATGGIALSDRKKIDELVQNHSCTEAGGTLRCSAQSQSAAHDALTGGKTLSLVSTVTLFSGAALAATGIVLSVVGGTSSTRPKSRVTFLPLVGPDRAGAVLGGTFE